jgi:catechol 2,3-dioxygenase-like lactoylglutathione lyase family enzyme
VPLVAGANALGSNGLQGSLDPPNEKDLAMDLRLELVVIPVSDVDRSKAFYADQFGFNSDHDHVVTPELRFVQIDAAGLCVLDRVRRRAQRCRARFSEGLAGGDGRHRGDPTCAARAWPRSGRGRRPGVGPVLHVEDLDGNQWAIQQIVRPSL